MNNELDESVGADIVLQRIFCRHGIQCEKLTKVMGTMEAGDRRASLREQLGDSLHLAKSEYQNSLRFFTQVNM